MTNINDCDPEAPVARYAVESSKLTAKIATPKLFQPNKDLKLSVFRTLDVDYDEVVRTGVSVARMHPTAKRLYGWATIKRRAVTKLGLVFDDDDHPPRHSNIVNWPDDRGKRLSLQQDMAAVAAPHALEDPILVDDGSNEPPAPAR